MFVRGVAAALLSVAAVGSGAAADLDMKAIDGKKAPLTAEVKAIPFFIYSDTQVSYWHQFTANEPGTPSLKRGDPSAGRDIPKNILSITHADSWAYGTNFLSLDILNSGIQDPAGTRNDVPGRTTLFGYGATEAYGIYRGTLSGNKITGTSAFAIPGFIKDVSLSYGMDANTKNTAFGPKKRVVVGGLVFSIDVPKGFLNVAVHGYKEWNRNGFQAQPYRENSYNPVPEFEIAFMYPLADYFGGFPLRIAGFQRIVMPKGRSSSPTSTPTNTEFLSRTSLVLDLGKLIWDKPGRLDGFVGFQYWRNKFGNDKDFYDRASTPAIYTTGISGAGSEEKTFFAGVSVHVF